MRPETFKQAYQSVKRLDTEETLLYLHATNQAVNGTEKSIKEFTQELDIYSTKLVDSASRIKGYQALLKKH